MGDNTFPTSKEDMSAKEILDKYYKVTPRDEYPKLIPYVDKFGEKVSPLTDFMYYHKLPEVYRVFDEPLGKPLYRYLQSIIEGGHSNLINSDLNGERGIDNLLDLIDPHTCPDEFLPYYCKSMGIDWFPDLITEERGTYYLRTFLCNVGEIYKRRGTESVVKYIAKVLTEMDVVLRYQRVFNKDMVTQARVLWVELQARTQEEIDAVELNAKVIKRFIDTQIPYYLTSIVTYVLGSEINTSLYTGAALCKTASIRIVPTSLFITTSDDYIYTIENDSVKLIFYKGTETRIQIPSEIEGKPVTEIESTCFTYSNVKYAVIPETVEKIY